MEASLTKKRTRYKLVKFDGNDPPESGEFRPPVSLFTRHYERVFPRETKYRNTENTSSHVLNLSSGENFGESMVDERMNNEKMILSRHW